MATYTNYNEELLAAYQKYLPKELLSKILDYREVEDVYEYVWPKEVAADVIEAMMAGDYVLTDLYAYLEYLDMDGIFSVIEDGWTYDEIQQTEDFEEKKQIAREKGLRLLKEWEAKMPAIIGNNNERYDVVSLTYTHRDDESLSKRPEPEKISLKERIKNFFRELRY